MRLLGAEISVSRVRGSGVSEGTAPWGDPGAFHGVSSSEVSNPSALKPERFGPGDPRGIDPEKDESSQYSVQTLLNRRNPNQSVPGSRDSGIPGSQGPARDRKSVV